MKKNVKHRFGLIQKILALCAVIALCAGIPSALAQTGNQGGAATLNAEELFSDRDLNQTPDLSDAVTYTVQSEEDILLTEAGVYVLTGSAENVTVFVEAGDKDKVQLVLDGVTVTNSDFPCIYVKSADKVFITTVSDSALSVTGTFRKDGSVNTDGAVFSRADLTLNGTAALTVVSTDNGVVCKDDLKITGGTYRITASSKAIEANDSIRIRDGSLTLQAGTDGLHAENSDDGALGYVYIGGGSLSVNAGDDGIHGSSLVQIDGGSLEITAAEGIEGTYIQINGGTVSIQARDDGINAAQKSSAYRPTVEINGGDVSISMGAGDTDGVDSNGDIYINGGTVTVTGSSTFDYDGTGQISGGTVIVNGQQVSTLPNQFMGGGPGGMGGRGGWGRGR
ncbi:MAG: carbohydrate-binding domain-containing protein [Clostridia bacterium]|nr:carbohydrate-binding domain-containing protein [Clostridia bacterium]